MDGFTFRQAGLPGEEPVLSWKQVNPKQVGTRAKGEVVQEADESVVVKNPRPMKAGNSEEGKTEGHRAKSRWGTDIQKSQYLRREEDKPKYARMNGLG